MKFFYAHRALPGGDGVSFIYGMLFGAILLSSDETPKEKGHDYHSYTQCRPAPEFSEHAEICEGSPLWKEQK